MLDADSLEGLVYAAGGCVENNLVIAPGKSPTWATSLLCACAVLCSDRSVARGSTLDYFTAAYRRLRGVAPEMARLAAAGLFVSGDNRVSLSPAWRAAWRLAQLLADLDGPATAEQLYLEYAKRYEPGFPGLDPGEHYFCEIKKKCFIFKF